MENRPVIEIHTDASHKKEINNGFEEGFCGGAFIASPSRIDENIPTSIEIGATSKSFGFHCPCSHIAELTTVVYTLKTYMDCESDIVINTDCYFCIETFNIIIRNIERIFDSIAMGKTLPIKPKQKHIGEKNIILRGLYAHIFSALIMRKNSTQINWIPRSENSSADRLASIAREEYTKRILSKDPEYHGPQDIFQIISGKYPLRDNKFYESYINAFHSMNNYYKEGCAQEQNTVMREERKSSAFFNMVSISMQERVKD